MHWLLTGFPALWSSGRKPGRPLFCCAPAECGLSSGSSVVGTPHWAREDHGLYSLAVQPVPGRCCIRAFFESGDRAVPASRSVRRDGRPDTPILRRGHCTSERADIRQRHRHPIGLRRLLDNCAAGAEDWKDRAAFYASDALSHVECIGMVDLTALRTCNLDHVRGTPRTIDEIISYFGILGGG